MQYVEDSAQPVGDTNKEEDLFLGTADESKAPNAKGWMVGPSSSKRKRNDEKNDGEQEATAPKKKKKGGIQPYTNVAEYISHDRYDTVPGETKHQRELHQQWIRRHWVRKWFNYEFIHPRFAQNFAFDTSSLYL
jgi:hypothetical protein